ncbi:MAG TPA: hypothetical protein VEH48_01370 [Candidatus Nitrosopolaris sp.]|nr:hypothetical protein [Candidatus Nitrosopolaris sp.]
MSDSRVEVIGQDEFNPREWLRRELLWASLMAPYRDQLDGWLDGRAIAQHDGNVTRRDLYDIDGDTEAKALAFFNQGKNIAGIISSAILLRAGADGTIEKHPADMLEVQANGVDRVLGRIAANEVIIIEIPEDRAYEVCSRLVHIAMAGIDRQDHLTYASLIMTELAIAETKSWLDTARQNEAGSLPILKISDGGYPRSAGARVDKLQPVFHKIIESEPYQDLAA